MKNAKRLSPISYNVKQKIDIRWYAVSMLVKSGLIQYTFFDCVLFQKLFSFVPIPHKYFIKHLDLFFSASWCAPKIAKSLASACKRHLGKTVFAFALLRRTARENAARTEFRIGA